MRAEALLEVIHAGFHNKPLEVYRQGLGWSRWTGPMIGLVEEMQRGVLFRVKRRPRSIWVTETARGELVGFDTDREYQHARTSSSERLIEFREVL